MKLYTLQTGTMKRKTVIDEETGTVGKVRYTAPHTFCLSPSELEANKHRLKEAGEAESNSPEVRDAFLNTNLLDNPKIKAPTGTTAFKTVDDITTVLQTPAAIAEISATTDIAKLDAFLKQEVGNTARVRKAVITAINDRKKELQVAQPVVPVE